MRQKCPIGRKVGESPRTSFCETLISLFQMQCSSMEPETMDVHMDEVAPRNANVPEFSGPRKSSFSSSFVVQKEGASLTLLMGFTIFLHG